LVIGSKVPGYNTRFITASWRESVGECDGIAAGEVGQACIAGAMQG
jgi:hypothetical protein